jgi:hypothetical protein
VFVFRNRRATAIKVLVYDGQGFWLCQKRLSAGRFRWWPADPTAPGQALEVHHLQVLLAAGTPWAAQAAPPWRRVSAPGGAPPGARGTRGLQRLRSARASATLRRVPVELAYRGRVITEADVAFIRALIAAHPAASRRALSKQLCDAWQWVQPNGALRDMVCRGLLLMLHRAGQIALPPARHVAPNPLVVRRRPPVVAVDTTPLRAPLAELRPLEFRQVRRTPAEPLFNSLLAQYHFLGYTQPVGEHLKYLVFARGRPVACLAWSSAPRHLGPRDRFIGWSAAARRRNLRFVAYNTRFLIVPWVQVPHLASHVLGRMAGRLARDWARVYGHPVYFLETFIDPARARGTCYRAANWVWLGRTTGRGKNAPSRRPTRSIKDVLGYPLRTRFRELLAEGG